MELKHGKEILLAFRGQTSIPLYIKKQFPFHREHSVVLLERITG